MTALLEKLITIIAPHHCVKCSFENNILCDSCMHETFFDLPALCVFCEKPTIDWQVCANCSKKTALGSVWVAGEYDGTIAELIKLYKFERVRAAYKPLARALDTLLQFIDPESLIVPLPTAPARVRQRGYDQSLLLAKELAKLRQLAFATPLARLNSERQVGADKKQRQLQANSAYEVVKPELVKGKQVWLIDDICTTGASLSAASKLLKKAGAARVDAAVIAWQRLKT